jgi:hypothetical protein
MFYAWSSVSHEVANRKEVIQQALKSQLPNPKFSEEVVSLSNPAHDFVAFRIAYTWKAGISCKAVNPFCLKTICSI